MTTPTSHPFFATEIVLASKHEKLQLIEPAFRQVLQSKMREVAVDTDQLGTFSGEIERKDPPRETAIKKARLGIEATGIPLGLASEGSIGSDPIIPWIQSDHELIVLVDAERNRIYSESFLSREITIASIEITAGDSLEDFLKRADFPRHALIVQPISPTSPVFFKGIRELADLNTAIVQSIEKSKLSKVRIQSDLRAMHSPSRRENIRKAAELLATRIAAQCPRCNEPGWGKIGFNYGVPCSDCGEVNPDLARAELLGCDICKHQIRGTLLNLEIDPSRCHYCNP
jgi:hypothetical protein